MLESPQPSPVNDEPGEKQTKTHFLTIAQWITRTINQAFKEFKCQQNKKKVIF